MGAFKQHLEHGGILGVAWGQQASPPRRCLLSKGQNSPKNISRMCAEGQGDRNCPSVPYAKGCLVLFIFVGCRFLVDTVGNLVATLCVGKLRL